MKIQYMGATTSPGLRNYPLQWWDELIGDRHPALPSERHLEATMRWLCRAQDAGDDDGIARMYHLRTGWGLSYPETTGYAIPTFLCYARHTGQEEFSSRAVRMADWECDIQMPSGAVQGGVVSTRQTAAIFNTGQVLFGWRAAYLHTGNDRFKRAAIRAADYLVAQMDPDGAWRKNLSEFCNASTETYAFNARSAWALLLANELNAGGGYREAALRNIEFVLSLVRSNGWVEQNCLSRPEQPLLHTIAYTYQGLLECAVIEGLQHVVEAVVRGNRALLERFREFGSLHGRYADNWRPTVHWRCLTGEAQTAIVWYRLGEVTGEAGWTAAARELLAAIKKTQQVTGPDWKAGGVKGSQPITAPYGRLEFLNWAAKFFADALMLDLRVPGAALAG